MKRGRFDVIDDMLQGANGGTKKTNLMHRANMSTKQIEGYLSLLINKKLVEKYSSNNGDGAMYKITKRGREFQATYRQLKGFII